MIKVMSLPTERQIKRIIKEFDVMSEDLEECPIDFFEYGYNTDTQGWDLWIPEDEESRFKKRISFILEFIKRNGGF